MNAVGIALVWCAVQVTLLVLLAGGFYLLVRRIQPAAGATVTLMGLLMIVALSAMALSPWPRWSLGRFRAEAAAAAGDGQASSLPGQIAPLAPADADCPRAMETAGQETRQDSPLLGPPFLQSLAGELPEPTSQPVGTTGHWPAVVAVVFLIAVTAGAAWLVVGLFAVRAYRTGSQPIQDTAMLELAEVLRGKLRCRRPVGLRQSDALVAAATIGWRRPILLLPAEWTSWTHEQRRAVLAHEIAHVRARHFLGVLFGQVGLVLHFYHPLVHWLMSRLRLEQELAADAAAADALGGTQDYLAAIAELALRGADKRMACLAQSFVPTRTTFLRRIAMLRDAKSPPERSSVPARVLAVGAVLLCGLSVVGLRGPSGGPTVFAQPAEKPAAVVADQDPFGGAGPQTADEAEEPVRVLDVLRLAPSDGRRREIRRITEEKGEPGAVYRADFRGAAFDHNTLVPFGFETLYGLQLLKPEPRGLRIVVPFHQGERKPSVGVLPLLKIHGDFEITASYEILAIEPPKKGAGAGANLYILAEKSLNGASLRRCVNPEGDQIYFVHASIRGEDGKRRPQYKHFAAKTRTGTLCFKRNGSVLQFLVGDGESGSLRKLHQVEFGTDTLGLLRIESTTDGSRTSVENLWKDLAIRAEKLEPVDIPLLRDRPRTATLQGHSGAELQVDGSARLVPEGLAEGLLPAVVDKSGGEPVK